MQAVRSSAPTARGMMSQAPERGLLDVGGGLGVAVRVVDVRTVYGRLQYLVEPVAGVGRRWVEAHRVVRIEDVPTLSGPEDGGA